MRVHGHRGAAAVRPENTLEAFEYAIGIGVDAIEMDIAVTRDDVPVVSHDPWIADGTAIRLLSRGELRERSPHVPALADVLELASAGTFLFNIEIKSFPGRPELAPEPDRFTRLVLPEIDRRGLRARCMLQSFDYRILHAAARQAREIPRGALFEAGELDAGDDFVEAAREAGASIAVPEFHLVTPDRVRAAHRAGLEVFTWTPDDPQDWRALMAAGVDAIITNDPGRLLAFIGR